mgnify:CR=1 FL=1|jgi:hypothetical protein
MAKFVTVTCVCGQSTVLLMGRSDQCDYCDRPMRADIGRKDTKRALSLIPVKPDSEKAKGGA